MVQVTIDTRHRTCVRTSVRIIGAVAITVAAGCVSSPGDERESRIAQASNSHHEIHPEDDCDPTTFGARCAPGHNGSRTLAQFDEELDETRGVNSWRFGGGEIRVNLGESFQVENRGGEKHNLAIVANYGGGRIAQFNQRSGNPIPAPECVTGAPVNSFDLASGDLITVATGAGTTLPAKGTFKAQCCFHPWMRTTVKIE
jgi:hypothetical protein